ncbi:hypothetical protein V493_03402 [Pseudogymnoascus sp. VKM F-4281 (FW-2241)]|nr:hypothetical protein V493_03402 [Pseudogymnoascus sp. VKM F-4281 (FW-2241)]
MEEYSYSPLPTPTSIRLVRIGKKDESGLFHCSIKTVDLEDAPWYYAFSYTWGNPHAEGRETHAFTKDYHALQPEYGLDGKKPILCNGKLLYINRNLYDAFGDVPKEAWRKFINRKNKNGFTKLHIYTLAGLPASEEKLRQLLHSGIDLNVTDNIGATAINWAARMGNFEIVKLLVDAGADIEIPNNDKKMALDYARDLKHVEIIEYLEKKTAECQELSPLEPKGDGPEVWAWVDQICINQEDLQERCLQVGIMNQIYSKSAFTLIWLGREDSYTTTAVSTIAKLAPAMERFVNSDIRPYSDGSEDAYIKAGIPYISLQEWESLAVLFQRQYFRRLWIIQENILSNLILSYCGSIEIPWRDFCVVAQLLELRQGKMGERISSKYVPLDQASRCIEGSVVQLCNWKERWQEGNNAARPRELSEENLIFDTWHFQATDPRDKIYGIYSLLNLGTSTSKWKVDYEKSVDQVFAEATKRIISDAGELRILSAVIDRSLYKIPTLPSWIPDYSVPFTTMLSANANSAGKLSIRSPLFSSSEPWNHLKVRGAQIDTVLRTGSTTSGPRDPHSLFHPSWLELTLLLPVLYHRTNQPRTEALWRTLCTNRDIKGSIPSPASYREDFHDMITRMLVRTAWVEMYLSGEHPEDNYASSLQHAVDRNQSIWSELFADLPIEDVECEYSDPSHVFFSENHQKLVYTLLKLHVLSITEGHEACTPTLAHLLEAEKILLADNTDPMIAMSSNEEKISDFVNTIRPNVGRRRLFVTKERLIGLGPAGMREGDEVWVLPSAGAIFILRKCNDDDDGDMRYSFIGDAYVHGVMDGEAVDGKEVEIRDVILV